MEDESANEMDSNHPLPSHHHHHPHHMDPMLNDSRKRTNHQPGNYHTPMGMVDSLAQQQNFVPGKDKVTDIFQWSWFVCSSWRYGYRCFILTITSINLLTIEFTE